jgi:tripartite-type tricarboxylate transporter receptor subunit TctC
MMAITRRSTLMSALATMVSPGLGWAQSYPSQLIRIINGYAPGAGIDVDSRIIAKQLEESLKATVVVDNRTGAFTNLAGAAVARSAPDGYTLLVSGHVTITSNVHLFRSVPFDPVKDFTPISLLGHQVFAFAVPSQSPARSLKELADYLKAKGPKASYGYSGTLAFMTAEWFKKLTGAPGVGVPYRAAGDALTAMVRNDIDLLIYDVGILSQQEQDGRLRVIAVTSADRSQLRPDVPGMQESGLPDFDLGPWVGVWGPAKMNPSIVDLLATTIVKVWDNPERVKALNGLGVEFHKLPPEGFPKFVQDESAKWERIIKALKIERQ